MDSTFLEKKHVYEQTPPILFVIEFIHEADNPTAKVGITFTVQYNFFQLINAFLEKKNLIYIFYIKVRLSAGRNYIVR